mmetsp:Transcript_10844/g.12392  ORF Transcript_10844/g.12392 Transcript_10844/m.12392 type:complete len:708 (+) Transcript_10844:280-2403(+)|eukprot:CAMPEP_0184016664 /NCGR_PEP_ID=MMETSP0954-20121128/7059_1 /TAXON_ID=627963 /ORGANISM="Aplanochytrium sp, Strain PBS07" /LENGTH=707 /DNA_ID=CAMNT_0026297719 /DNA_START=226 /DNA_END=2349 /DNA_ORIENTATION=-
MDITKESLWAQIRSLPTQGHHLSVTTVTVDEEGEYLYTTGDDNTAKKWRIRSGQVVTQYLGHSDSVWCLGLPKNRTDIVFTGSRDALVKRWDRQTGAHQLDYAGHEGEDPGVRCMTMLPAQGDEPETTFFTGSRDFTVRQWDIDSGECTRILNHDGIVWNIFAAPNGLSVFSCSADKTVKQWDATSDSTEPVKVLEHPDFVWSVAVSPDSQSLYSGCRDFKARKWNIETGEEVLTFEGHTDTVRWVSLNKSGTRLLTAGYDVKIKEWNAETGVCLQDITAHEKAVLCVTSSPDDSIFSSSADSIAMRFSSVQRDADGGGSAILTEAPLTEYTNIPSVKIGLLVLAIIVQALQIAGFAFNLDFPWNSNIAWLQNLLAAIGVKLSYILDKLDQFDIGEIEVGVLVWTYFVAALFFVDAYGWLQALKSKLNENGWGKVKKSRYKGDNPLEKGERTAANKAEWEVWETVTWIYWFVNLTAFGVASILWLASTLLAIPTVGFLVTVIANNPDQAILVLSGVGLVIYCIVFLRMRLCNSNAALVSFLRKNHTNKSGIPGMWLLSIGGVGAMEALGPFTVMDWQADFGQAGAYLGFAIINNSNGVTILALAVVNLLLGLFLVYELTKYDTYFSFQSSRMLFVLQCLQMWNSLIALVVVLGDDADSSVASIVWYIGFFPLMVGSYASFYRIYAYRSLKSSVQNSDSSKVIPKIES